MKRSPNSLPDRGDRSDSADLPLKLYRVISDAVRQLENQRARIEHVSDLFSDPTESLRMKIRDYGDKLMFTDPVAYGKKAEDLIWRKVFHEPVATFKKLNKNMKMDPRETFVVLAHLQSGIGFYHHLIMKLQSQFRLDLRGVVDFPLLVTDCGLNKGKSCWSSKLAEGSALEWAHSALHRCLIYLGDICRYLADLEPSCDHNNALRYYVQALNWKPDCGTPHNQLGFLASNVNYSLDAAYHFMRCLCCKEKFDAAEGNLRRLMDTNAVCYQDLSQHNYAETSVQKLILAFIHLACSLFYDKPVDDMPKLCSEIFTELECCMTEAETRANQLNNNGSGDPTFLNDDMLFKMLVMSIMCVQQLQSKNSSHTVTALALCLALISQLLQICIHRIGVVIPLRRRPVPFKKCIGQPRRRRRRGRVSSDMSEDENESIYSVDSDISEEELIFDQFPDSEDEHAISNGKAPPTIKAMNGFNSKPRTDYDSNMPWDYPIIATDKCFKHVHKLCNEGFIFQTLKVAFNWIESNRDVLSSFAPASTPFFDRLLIFLNHLSSVPSHAFLKENFDDDIISEDLLCSIPLPEDVTVRGLAILNESHAKINWEYFRIRHLKPAEETYSRIVSFVKIGRLICDKKISPISYDASKQWFTLLQTNGVTQLSTVNGVSHDLNGRVSIGKPSNGVRLQTPLNNVQSEPQQNGKTPEPAKEDRKGTSSPWETDPARVEKLMHNMGELWLKSEVSHLEDKTRKGMKENLPPYIVPDADAFLNHSSLIKQLISVKKFIVLIPSVVVSALDECKQCSNKVRDTIRWLEWQLRNGKRNIRLQRPNEHQPIPFIKYPKKKDKDAWMFIQVVECCNYLCNQSTGEKNPELVTLLTGSKHLLPNGNHSSNGFSPFGVAKSAGINVEHIESFFSKWKSSSKSHG